MLTPGKVSPYERDEEEIVEASDFQNCDTCPSCDGDGCIDCDDTKICRICSQSKVKDRGELFHPCRGCKEVSSYVHEKCFKEFFENQAMWWELKCPRCEDAYRGKNVLVVVCERFEEIMRLSNYVPKLFYDDSNTLFTLDI